MRCTRRPLAPVVVAATILGISHPPLTGQQVVRIPSAVSCAECTIELEPVVTLGGPNDSSVIFAGSRVEQDSRGIYYVGPVLSQGQVAVYDSTGKQIRVIGTYGKGPKELERIDRIVLDRYDTLHVFHRLRHTVYSPSFEFVRTSRLLGRVGRVAFLANGIQVAPSYVVGSERAGYPLHLMTGDSVVLSFGHKDTKQLHDIASLYAMGMQAVPSTTEGVWISHWNQYRMERWDTAGQLQLVLERDASWFPPWTSMGGMYDTKGGPVQEDETGQLWTISGLPPALLSKPRPTRGGLHIETPEDRPDFTSYENMFGGANAIIEVLDPSTAKLVASRRFPFFIGGFAGDGLIFRFNEDSIGYMVLEVHRVTLRR